MSNRMTSDKASRPSQRATTETYRLTTSFPYLVRRVGLRIGELFDRAVEPFGVNVSMYRVMAALAEEDGQQLGRLSELTKIELSTLSRLVGAMVAKGLLTRRRPRDNGRIVEISLSSRGRRLTDELVVIAVHFENTAVDGLSEADIAGLKSQLDAIYDNLDRLEQEVTGASLNRAAAINGSLGAGTAVKSRRKPARSHARRPGHPT